MKYAQFVAALTMSFALFGAAQSQTLPSAAPDAVGLSRERLEHIGRVLAADVESGKLPGAVIAIARKGKLAYFATVGFRDKPAQSKMGTDSIFRIYSMTKPWTSVAAMILVEEGRVELTDPVSKYLPAFKKQNVSVATVAADGQKTYQLVPAKREATIQDLLRHTSGLSYDFVTNNPLVKQAYEKAGLLALKASIRDKMTANEFVEGIAEAPLASEPGTTWEYSLSTAVLGRVVETVAGMPLSAFLKQRLFDPLHMMDSGFTIEKAESGRVAQPLLPYEVIELFDPTVPAANDLGGEGGLSTASDYLRFAQMLLNGGQLDGVRILSRTTVALMTSDQLGSRPSNPAGPGELLLGVPGYTFGLGFTVRNGPGLAGVPGSAGEFMWGGAAGTFFWVDPREELAVVFMAQVPFSMRAHYRRLVTQLVYAAIAD
jgi:CubicO group peptidase (beta-lactamase class C family)